MNKIVKKYLGIFALLLVLFSTDKVLAKECMVCSGAYIPLNLVDFCANIVNIIQVLVPVIIILTGMLELLKSIIAGDEKKIDEVKPRLVRKFIAGIAIFLVFVIVKFAFGLLGSMTANSYLNCASCFINKDCPNKHVKACPSRTDYENGVTDDNGGGSDSGSESGDNNNDDGSQSGSDTNGTENISASSSNYCSLVYCASYNNGTAKEECRKGCEKIRSNCASKQCKGIPDSTAYSACMNACVH